MKLRSQFLQALLVAGLSWMVAGCGGNQSTPSDAPSLSRVSVSVSPKSVVNLPAGGTQTFTATVTGSTNQGVIWSIREGASCGSISNSGTGGDYSAPNSPRLTCHIVATSQADTSKRDIATVTISPISMYVLPFQVSLGVGQMQTFAASVQGTTNASVTWSVKEGFSGGSITNQGVYTAPQTLGAFHVIATSQADSRFTAAAEVDVVPITVSISPVADTLGPTGTRTFAASVVGTNQAVSWSIQEGAAGGSITSAGVYTASQTLGTFHVVATSQADGTASAAAMVSVVASGFTQANPMNQKRAQHTATLLNNGVVLLAGGGSGSGCNNNSTELYDAATGSFTASALMSVGRAAHTATLLRNGKVLIAGGATCASPSVGELFDSGDIVGTAEVFDPAASAFAPTGSMSTPRQSHTATLLPDGKVLIAGGDDNSGLTLASAELYDPVSGTFTPTGMMHKPRIGHSATLLSNGKVLVAGGYAPCSPGCIDLPDNTAELYDPSTGTFTTTGSLLVSRAIHTATLLTSGLVLIAGGDFCGLSGAGAGSECAPEDGTNEAELYDPATGAFAQTGIMTIARVLQSATLLSDGTVLVTGGEGADTGGVTFIADLYFPSTRSFGATGSMAGARAFHTATLLASGMVLVTGGLDENGAPLATAELYK